MFLLSTQAYLHKWKKGVFCNFFKLKIHVEKDVGKGKGSPYTAY